MRKPKILHIGGSDSAHVIGVVEQIKKSGKFDQTIISYTDFVYPHDKKWLDGINVYTYNYPKFFTRKELPKEKEKNLRAFVNSVLKKEKPDLVHGHYLSKCSVPMFYAQVDGKIPGVVHPWSVWDITKNPVMFKRNNRCMQHVSYALALNEKFLYKLLDNYNQPHSKFLLSGAPIRLHLYKDSFPDLSEPRIFIVRKYYQPTIYKMLPKLFEKFSGIHVLAKSPPALKNKAKKMKLTGKLHFVKEPMLSQEAFAEVIKQHNIIFSMAPDLGNSSITIQAAYSGAVTLVHKTPWDNLFNDGEHVIKCNIDEKDIYRKLVYVIKNYKSLCKKFKQNNDMLKAFGSEITGANLLNAYEELIG